MPRLLSCFLLTLLLWLAITGSVERVGLGAGLCASALIAFGLRRTEFEDLSLLLRPTRLLWGLLYVPVLFAYVVRANLDVAYRVLHPALPIRPGIVKARTSLSSPAGRVLLANSITLTPGTLSVDLVDDVLYVHRIHVPEEDPDGDTERSLAQFEGFIRRIFE